MGSFLGEEKIGALSFVGNVITLQKSTLKIGGRLISVPAVSLDTLGAYSGANQLHYLYVLLVAGVPTLVQTFNNPPSSYIVANPLSQLVGAFYTDEFPTIASFVSIEGKPASRSIQYIPKLESNVPGVITLNGVNPKQPEGYWFRDGNKMKLQFAWKNGTGGTASGPAGATNVSIPENLLASLTDLASDATYGKVAGYGQSYNATDGNEAIHWFFVYGDGHIAPTEPESGSLISAAAGWSAARSANFDGEFEIAGWSNTPLKDL